MAILVEGKILKKAGEECRLFLQAKIISGGFRLCLWAVAKILVVDKQSKWDAQSGQQHGCFFEPYALQCFAFVIYIYHDLPLSTATATATATANHIIP